MSEEERIICPWCQGSAMVPEGPPYPGDWDKAYRHGVDDLLRVATEGRDALISGALQPDGIGVRTVRSFVSFLTDQATKLKGAEK